ncbi:hypothetical protein J6590_108612 [Homalodisca vitripennis]|nr:hypothetical protein J6590_108612 [Homalodisca vitripennis]
MSPSIQVRCFLSCSSVQLDSTRLQSLLTLISAGADSCPPFKLFMVPPSSSGPESSSVRISFSGGAIKMSTSEVSRFPSSTKFSITSTASATVNPSASDSCCLKQQMKDNNVIYIPHKHERRNKNYW